MSIAVAKQLLVYSHGATRIDDDAREQVQRIAAKVRAVTTSGADAPTIDAQLAPLFDQLVAVVNDGLQNREDGARSDSERAA